jgi:hypothetical protein
MNLFEQNDAKAIDSSSVYPAATKTELSMKSVNGASNKQRKVSPFIRKSLQLLRRGHLYLGLFLLPWALLYGVTGFLFNHPTAFSDSRVVYFDRQDLSGTELENLPQLGVFVEDLIERLNVQNTADAKWTVGQAPIRYSGRDTFVATVKTEARSYFFVFDPHTQSGLIRENTTKRPTNTAAPFATSVLSKAEQTQKPATDASPGTLDPLKNLESIVERIQRSASMILERKGFPSGVATVTSGPDIKFSILAADGEWSATYNPISKQVGGAKGEPVPELSWRSFLLRMHLSHKYPSQWNTKWVWALGVDAMALTLCFWGLSGLVMWWQIKATRRTGTVVLIVSLIAAVFLGLGMYSALVI